MNKEQREIALRRRTDTFANRMLDEWEVLLYRAFRRLPIDLAPTLAVSNVSRTIRKYRPWAIERARSNLRMHLPAASTDEIEAKVASFVQNMAAFVGETASVERLIAAGRVEIVGADVRREAQTGPCVALCLHTGNWEVLSAALRHLGGAASTFFEEAESRGQTRVITDLRSRLGMGLLEPTPRGLRDALVALKRGETVAMFGDEARDGHLMAPFFGREPHLDGNLALIVRLARRGQARIILCYATRLGINRFRVTFGPLIALPHTSSDIDDVTLLDRMITPVIRAHLDQWYYLDDSVC